MRAIRVLSGNETIELVDLWAIRDALGLDDDRMANAIDFLEGEGLIDTVRTMTGQRTPIRARIEHTSSLQVERIEAALPAIEEQRTPPRAAITKSGVREIAVAEQSPDEPTALFPPYSSVTIHIGGNVYGSPFQVASPGAGQHVECRVETAASGDVRQIQAFLSEYYAGSHGLRLSRELTSDEFAEILAEVGTLQAQVTSPRPKAVTIRLSLAAISKIVERVAEDASSAKLLLFLGQISV
jgi:hypothetical protein